MRVVRGLGFLSLLWATTAAQGEFRFYVDSTMVYDDNYLREEKKEDSFLFIPRVAGAYILDTYETQLNTRGQLAGYYFTEDEDRSFLSYTHSLDLSCGITDYTVAALRASFVISDNPGDSDVFGDDTAWQTYMGGEVAPRLRSHLVGDKVVGFLGGIGSFRDYKNTRRDDWNHMAGQAGLEGILGDRTSVIVDGTMGIKDFSGASDYSYWNARTGLRRQFNESIGTEVYVGYTRRDYDRSDPDTKVWNTVSNERGGEGEEKDQITLVAQVDGSMGLGEFSNMTLRIINNIEDSVQYTGEYYVNRGGDVTFKHEWTDKLQTYLTLYYFNRDYQNQDRNDDCVGGSATVRYLALDWLGISMGFAHDERLSNVNLSDYTQNRVWLTGDVTF